MALMSNGVIKHMRKLSKAYRDLAIDRASFAPCGYCQPEQFGYDFYDWISPYTKGANRRGGVAIVLQDWASAEGLPREPDPEIQALGRKPSLKTNQMLRDLLLRVLGRSMSEVYATNAFPFVKLGTMSSRLSQPLVNAAAQHFLRQELDLAEPKIILALGRVAHRSLVAISRPFVKLPHPAARIGTLCVHEAYWRKEIPAHFQVEAAQ